MCAGHNQRESCLTSKTNCCGSLCASTLLPDAFFSVPITPPERFWSITSAKEKCQGLLLVTSDLGHIRVHIIIAYMFSTLPLGKNDKHCQKDIMFLEHIPSTPTVVMVWQCPGLKARTHDDFFLAKKLLLLFLGALFCSQMVSLLGRLWLPPRLPSPPVPPLALKGVCCITEFHSNTVAWI